MEPVQAQQMHITETKPLCSVPPKAENGIEEISKQLENELLYGGTDDGEALSDDALSEDSYRLRVSDDENEEGRVNASKTVENVVDKTELMESTPNVLGTNGKTLQLNKINGSNAVYKRGKNAQQDFTEDYTLGEDNFCENKIKLNPELCSQLSTLPTTVISHSSSSLKTKISVKSHKALSAIDCDSNNVEKIKCTHSRKLLPTSRGESPIDEHKPKHNYLDNFSKTDSSDSNPTDKHKKNVEKKLDDCEVVPVTPKDEGDNIILENSIESDEHDDAEKGINEQTKDGNDGKDDCQIVNSVADKVPFEEKSPDTGSSSTSSLQPTAAIDKHSKDESIKSDDSSSVVKDKPSEIGNPPLECSEIISDIDSASSVKTSVEIHCSSKRRFSISENEKTAVKKIVCAAEACNEHDAIEILDETDGPAKKIIVRNNILKTLLAEHKRPKVNNDEIIDLDDDNTVDSMSSELSLSANDSLTNSDCANDKTKQQDSAKEINGEKENVDDLGTRKIRKVRGDGFVRLVSGKDIIARAKRGEAAEKAEETVQKNIVILNNDSDSESIDTNNMIPCTRKARAPSPVSLKRNHLDEYDERVDLSSTAKKFKTDIGKENAQIKTEAIKTESKKTFESVRKFFLRDGKEKLKKLTQEELEELFIQKIVETITMREEIGKLREKAKISERNQEATRLKCQQLSKQINDFDMVLSRYNTDRRNNPAGNVAPIKINRSVGLQVNFLTDHGVQNLRQLQSAGKGMQTKPLPTSPMNGLTPPQNDDVNARRGIKVRSPRRTEGPIVAAPVGPSLQNSMQAQPLISTAPPSSIAVPKPIDTRTPMASTGQTFHHVVVNGVTNSITRTTKVLTSNNKNNAKLIDLTEEPEKKNSLPPPLTAIITTNAGPTHMPKVQPRYQRVVPATTGVTIAQSAIRLVQPAGQPTPTALVNNMSNSGGGPRFVVMQPGRQLVIAPNGNQIRATTGNTRTPISNITYATVPTMANGTVRVVPTSGTTVQLFKVTHPAPLPDVTTYPVNPALKLPPPAPSLKISKVAHGIVLSWNMVLSDKFADIASYQLYAYQEIAGMAPSSSNWKKVGDVRALPLPMACTLTQFSEGNNYYFAVRAVDTHSRYGHYSQPGNISL